MEYTHQDSTHDLAAYIELLMHQQGLTRKLLALKLKYKNTNNAYALLDKIKQGEIISKEQVDILATALQVSSDSFYAPIEITLLKAKEKMAQVRETQKAKERNEFKPYIYSITEKEIPSQIFVGLITHAQKFVKIDPRALGGTAYAQLEYYSRIIRHHYSLQNGIIGSFGHITHYVLHRYYDEAVSEKMIFDIHGEWKQHPPADIKRKENAGPGGFFIGRKKLVKFRYWKDRNDEGV